MLENMSTKTAILVVSSNPDAARWLKATLGASADVASSEAASPALLLRELETRGKPTMLFCEVEDYNTPERVQLIEAVAERYPELPVVGLGSADHSEVVLAAMRAGARDFFVVNRDDTKLAAQVGKLLRRAGAAAVSAVTASGGQGKLYVVIGAQPNEGIAFLASHLALASVAAAKTGERVLLADAATPAGASAVMLNLTPSYGLPDAVADVNRCDATLMDTAFTKHPSGLHLLCLPEDDPIRPSLPTQEFVRLLQVFRTLFATTVLCCDGSAGAPFLRALIQEADRSLLMTDQSIVRSRQCKVLLRNLRLEDTPLERTGLVVDNYRRRLGLEPANLAELLDLPLTATLSTEGVARIQAMNSGESLFDFAPKDPYCDAVRRLSVSLAESQAKPAAESGGGLLGRWFN